MSGKDAFKGDEYEFAFGCCYGLRRWLVDYKGRLTGVTHTRVWKPGENVSKCYATNDVAYTICSKKKCDKPRSGEWWAPPGAHVHANNEPAKMNSHHFDPNCECGFWAYNSRYFGHPGEISGIIAGYGKTTIGDRGFRAEKAKIIALAIEKPNSPSLLRRLQELYPDVEQFRSYDEMIDKHYQLVEYDWETGPSDPGFWDDENPLTGQLVSGAGQVYQNAQVTVTPGTIPNSVWTWTRGSGPRA